MSIVTIIVFTFGLIVGSFLNVCILRIPKEESIAFPPSHCGICKTMLKPYDLIPVISYIFLKGRCRYCGEKISIRYPLTEVLTAVVFLNIYMVYGLSLEFSKYILLASLLIVIGIIDLDTTDIYFSTTLTGIIISIIFILLSKYFYGESILNYVYGGLVAGGFIGIIILTTKGMGWGDAELFFMIGLYLGLKLAVIALILSFIIGSICSILLIISRKKSRKDLIPFGPFISISSVFALLLGEKIFAFYISLFF